jgi:urease accessory protein
MATSKATPRFDPPTPLPGFAAPPAAGQGVLEVARVAGASAVVGMRARAPLHLLVPRPRGAAVWAYAATFGGGLVAGDTIDLSVRVGPGARALLATQASTKIYRSEGPPAHQNVAGSVEGGALLAVLPDAISCFTGAVYEQRQRFDLAPEGSLLLVDWLSAGRAARAERWRFSSYRSLTEIRVGGRLLVREALLLEDGPAGPIEGHLGRFDSIAFIAIIGPLLAEGAAAVLARIGAPTVRPAFSTASRRAGGERLLASASPLGGGAVLRVAGESVEEVGAFIRNASEILPSLLGDDPWARKA